MHAVPIDIVLLKTRYREAFWNPVTLETKALLFLIIKPTRCANFSNLFL